MVHLSDRETAILIDALSTAAAWEDEVDDAGACEAVKEVQAKITARMTPATFGLYVATEGEVAVGDQLQSSASRLAEWVLNYAQDTPYDADEAALEARSASAQWTEVRRG